MEEYARIDKNERRCLMAITSNKEMRRVKTDDSGKLLLNTVGKNENYTNRDEYSLQDVIETPGILGLTKTGKLRRIKTSVGGLINIAPK